MVVLPYGSRHTKRHRSLTVNKLARALKRVSRLGLAQVNKIPIVLFCG